MANLVVVEVDEAVDRQDPTGGRGVSGEIGGKLDVKGQRSEAEVLASAV